MIKKILVYYQMITGCARLFHAQEQQEPVRSLMMMMAIRLQLSLLPLEGAMLCAPFCFFVLS